MRSIDITFDDALDAAVRAEWKALADVGVPSLASHVGSSNRPHVTLAAGAELELHEKPVFESFAIELGAAVIFPRKSGFLLALSVTPTSGLLELHRRVQSSITGAIDHTLVDRWMPHVTLSRKISPEQLASALAVIASPSRGRVTGLRSWDGETQTVTDLSSPEPR